MSDRRLHVYLFTDLVGSTDLKRRLGDVEGAAAIAAHDKLFRECLKRHGGTEQNNPGDGFFATFELPSAALNCALEFQIGLSELDLAETIQSRVGIHMGESVRVEGGEAPDKLLGLAIDFSGRIMSLAEGNQILLTRHVYDSVRQQLKEAPDGSPIEWCSHGSFVFKGAEEPLEVFEAGIAGLSPLRAPKDSAKAKRVFVAPARMAVRQKRDMSDPVADRGFQRAVWSEWRAWFGRSGLGWLVGLVIIDLLKALVLWTHKPELGKAEIPVFAAGLVLFALLSLVVYLRIAGRLWKQEHKRNAELEGRLRGAGLSVRVLGGMALYGSSGPDDRPVLLLDDVEVVNDSPVRVRLRFELVVCAKGGEFQLGDRERCVIVGDNTKRSDYYATGSTTVLPESSITKLLGFRFKKWFALVNTGEGGEVRMPTSQEVRNAIDLSASYLRVADELSGAEIRAELEWRADDPLELVDSQEREAPREDRSLPVTGVAITHRVESISDGRTKEVFLTVRNKNQAAIPKAKVTFVLVEPDGPDTRRYLGLPLRLKDDLATHDQPLPREEFSLYGRESTDIALLRWNDDSEAFTLYHAKYRLNPRTDGGGVVHHLNRPQVPEKLPNGKYRISIEVRSESGQLATATYRISATKESFSFLAHDASRDDEGLVHALRACSTQHAIAKIECAATIHVPLVEKLAGQFELAGWGVNLNKTPQEPFRHRYIGGTNVRGVNSALVHAVADALQKAGFVGVRTEINANPFTPDSPKYPYVITGVRLMVGHQKEEGGGAT